MKLIIRPFLNHRPLVSGIRPLSTKRIAFRAMSTSVANGVNGQAAQAAQSASKANGEKKEVKILMLHGFTQSGALFHAKTRAMEKMLTKLLAPVSIIPVLIYPTGPNRLKPQDIPGYVPPEDEQDDGWEPDTWAWFRKDDATGSYRYVSQGMNAVAEAIREAGGVDGVIGFSQGGCMSGMVTAALETDRPLPEGEHGEWAQKLREANAGQPVKFGVSYSGFKAADDKLQFLYEAKISTPTLHVIGSLDTVVEESRCQALADRCQDPQIIVHPGGHHVPVSKEWVMPIAGFVKKYAHDEVRPGL